TNPIAITGMMNGTQLFVANQGSGDVSVIDTTKNCETNRISLASAGAGTTGATTGTSGATTSANATMTPSANATTTSSASTTPSANATTTANGTMTPS